MAVSDDIYNATEDLILAKPRRRFRTGIRWQHWQLRSLIGTDGQHVVYFPVPDINGGGCTVHRLNTKTRETETVKRLAFNPKCLVARNGWVCCGGELGAFSSFRVGQQYSPHESARRFAFEADDRLPLSLEIPDATPTSQAEARFKNLVAPSTGFGEGLVNCITLWFPPSLVDAHDGAYDQGVAVLALNDRSVVVVSLRDQEALDKITYPDYMNRGVISPDGRLLIAISDDPYLYIHERKEKRSEDGTPVRVSGRLVYEWNACGRIQLKGQRQDDHSGNRGSFAVCFSSTGDFLAVGTQYGNISIFDVSSLTVLGAGALITSFSASRPNAEFGAVRDMAFSPGPMDLLAWTEDRGRVGVADVRALFDSRQILYLDKDDEFEILPVLERGTIDPRLIEQRGDRGESSLPNFANAVESRLTEGRPSLARYNVPLSAEETAVLEAIQDFRRRQDQYNAAPNRSGTESGSNNSSNGGGAGGGGASSSGTRTGSASSRPPWAERAARTAEGSGTRERTASVSRAVNEILDNIRDQRERIRDSQARLRAREDNAPTERRRYAANPSLGVDTAPGTAGSRTSGRGALVSRLMAGTANPASSGSWDNVEALYGPSTSGAQPSESPDTSAPVWAHADSVRRYRAAFLMREWEENPSGRVLGRFMTSHPRPGPYDTAGLSWSENGDILFVGAENGVFEFHVNTFQRRLYPSITLS